MMALGLYLAERAWLPDAAVRSGIRLLLRSRLKALHAEATRHGHDERAFGDFLAKQPIASHTAEANQQHYEVPTSFFKLMLGQRLKYSAALYPAPCEDLDEAENHMLRLTCERAELVDGQRILELGCGWGSLTLWMAEHYPKATITAVTNSSTQQEYVSNRARELGSPNVTVLLRDVNALAIAEPVDRVVSVEMFEHMRNYESLLGRIHQWLKPGGKLFVHVFAHRSLPYIFETTGTGNWMGRYFFTGGTMPSHGLLPSVSSSLICEADWRLNGRHYARTLRSWLDRLDRNRPLARKRLENTYPPHELDRWLQRWRIFLMASEELFQYREGEEWGISHYRFRRPAEAVA
ncbi:MAG: cyclopropane-fatty-acyl-phospholipid synthase [Verrucomicrobia bacterium]|nr:cyclopropane-fatty-acyl-phospholipid synthase [Verrucomicrobiota bacterium]